MALGPIHHHDDFQIDDLVARKAGRVVSVCLPARNEAATVGAIVEQIRLRLVDEVPLVDEILVIDDHSTDRTAEVAVAAGAKVVPADSVLPEFGVGHGKGEAIWKSVFAAQGDLLVWCDADIENFDARFVVGLLGPLLVHDDVVFVKGFYDRPEVHASGGGRVTELVARPLLSLYFPELTGVIQPLAGEFAARRSAVEHIPIVEGYGVDLGMVIDLADRFGPEALAQVDLERRIDRNRTLPELGPQALAVMQTALRRAGAPVADRPTLRRPGQPPVEVDIAERPALSSIADYRVLFPSVPGGSGRKDQ